MLCWLKVHGILIYEYFIFILLSGAIECFRRDMLCLIQHTHTSNHVEAKYQDLLLAVKVEVDVLNSKIMIVATSIAAAPFQQPVSNKRPS